MSCISIAYINHSQHNIMGLSADELCCCLCCILLSMICCNCLPVWLSGIRTSTHIFPWPSAACRHLDVTFCLLVPLANFFPSCTQVEMSEFPSHQRWSGSMWSHILSGLMSEQMSSAVRGRPHPILTIFSSGKLSPLQIAC